MEFLGYFLGGFGTACALWAVYHSRVIIRLKREGYIEYPMISMPKDETLTIRED